MGNLEEHEYTCQPIPICCHCGKEAFSEPEYLDEDYNKVNCYSCGIDLVINKHISFLYDTYIDNEK